MTQQFRNIIDGKTVDAASGATYDLVNPPPARSSRRAASGAEDVDAAMRAAATAFETWRETTPAERQQALLKIADAVEARADELVDVGGPKHRQADRRSPPPRSCRRRSTRSASSPAPPGCSRAGRPASTWPGHTSYVRREPIGVVRAR